MVTINHKRGDTFSYGGTVTLAAGPAWTASAMLRTQQQAYIDTLVVTLTAPVDGTQNWPILLYASPEQTTLWPLDYLLCDVKFTDANNAATVVSSASFGIQVGQDITHA